MSQFSSDQGNKAWFEHDPLTSSNLISTVNEIEEDHSSELSEINHHIPAPLTENGNQVYVAVGKNSSSMDALTWTLKHALNPSTFVYLIHVFPEVHRIPTPLGMLPKNKVRPEQVESHMSQERNKRTVLLQKFLSHCNASKVNAETILIESDLIAKAIVDLIPILNIRELVVGSTKSSLRKLKEGSGKVEHIYKNAPDFCRVKIICGGKEVIIGEMSSLLPTETGSYRSEKSSEVEEKKDSFSCTCFSSKLI
ncbi:U-box domain-containing protein 37-like [Tasmannia lanceolata]|uniref:U-box domain-containing protein 37-like n=1 Tax=Tasmannia lanceolata TaxID=3420 RepID=UPI0040632778